MGLLVLADPGGTAERIAAFLCRIGKEGNYTLTLHGLLSDLSAGSIW